VGGAAGPGFASVGEIALVLRRKALTLDPSNNPVNVNNWSYFSYDSTLDNDSCGPGNPYRVAMDRDASNALIATDDGFAATGYGWASGLLNDLTKYHSYYEWASNHLTVRSDTYIIYITVLAGTVESSGTLTGVTGNQFSDSGKAWNIPNQWQTVMAAFINPADPKPGHGLAVQHDYRQRRHEFHRGGGRLDGFPGRRLEVPDSAGRTSFRGRAGPQQLPDGHGPPARPDVHRNKVDSDVAGTNMSTYDPSGENCGAAKEARIGHA